MKAKMEGAKNMKNLRYWNKEKKEKRQHKKGCKFSINENWDINRNEYYLSESKMCANRINSGIQMQKEDNLERC